MKEFTSHYDTLVMFVIIIMAIVFVINIIRLIYIKQQKNYQEEILNKIDNNILNIKNLINDLIEKEKENNLKNTETNKNINIIISELSTIREDMNRGKDSIETEINKLNRLKNILKKEQRERKKKELLEEKLKIEKLTMQIKCLEDLTLYKTIEDREYKNTNNQEIKITKNEALEKTNEKDYHEEAPDLMSQLLASAEEINLIENKRPTRKLNNKGKSGRIYTREEIEKLIK